MTRLPKLFRSFAGGELSPEMLGRPDDSRYGTGLRRMRDFMASPRGPAVKRTGMQHVARTQGDVAAVVRPFIFSGDQTTLVEVGVGYFRFYTNGLPLLYAETRVAASVDAATDEITFAEPHGFVGGESVRAFAIGVGDVLPTPLDDETPYTVEVVDGFTLKLSGEDLTDAGTGTLRLIPTSQVPRNYSPSQNAIDINLGTNEIMFGVSPQLVTGDPITVTSTHFPPRPMVPGVTYFAIVVDALTIKPAYTEADALAGTAIDLTGAPCEFDGVSNTVLQTLHTYVAGEKVTFTGFLPPQIVQGQSYFVMPGPGLNAFQISETPGGPQKTFDSVTGSFSEVVDVRVHHAYEIGDQVYLTSVPQGFYQCTTRDPQDNAPVGRDAFWYRLPDDGEIQIPNNYTASQLPELGWAQSEESVTFTSSEQFVQRLSRLSATQWTHVAIPIVPPIPAPTGLAAVRTFGFVQTIDAVFKGPGDVAALRTANRAHGLGVGEQVYLEGAVLGGATPVGDGFYVVDDNVHGGNPNQFTVVDPDTGVSITVSTAQVAAFTSATVRGVPLTSDRDNTYTVTAVNPEDVESQPSAELLVEDNSLLVTGSQNVLTWLPVPGAARYRIYRKKNGLFGQIGQTSDTSFVDDNLDPQLDKTQPILEPTLVAAKPRAVAQIDQRLCLGGFADDPTRVIASRAGADLDFSFHLPLRADDRLKFSTALDGSPVRHLLAVPNGLLCLTSSAELLLEAIGDEALAPETIRLRTLSRIGCRTTPAQVFDDRPVFWSRRGSYPYTLAISSAAAEPVNLGVRANHLFDDYTIRDASSVQAPFPLLYAARSDGSLLCATFLPEEDVLGWSLFTADGVVESVCGLTEGDEDVLYAVVLKGAERSIVRMSEDPIYLDDSVLFDGTNRSATTVTITGGVNWTGADVVSLVTSIPLAFRPGDFVEVEDQATGTAVRFTILRRGVTGLVWQARSNRAVPVGIRNTATTAWKHGRKTVPTHRQSDAVTVFADGVTRTATTAADGTLTLPEAAVVIHVGTLYVAELQTLPVSVVTNDGGQKGIRYNVAKAWVGLSDDSGPFEIGPPGGTATKVAPGVEEARVLAEGSYGAEGEVRLRSVEPVPLTVHYLALDLVAVRD